MNLLQLVDDWKEPLGGREFEPKIEVDPIDEQRRARSKQEKDVLERLPGDPVLEMKNANLANTMSAGPALRRRSGLSTSPTSKSTGVAIAGLIM